MILLSLSLLPETTLVAHLVDSGSSEEDDTGDEVVPSEESDFDLELEAPSDDDLEFVLTEDTTLDSTLESDEPLSVHITKKCSWDARFQVKLRVCAKKAFV